MPTNKSEKIYVAINKSEMFCVTTLSQKTFVLQQIIQKRFLKQQHKWEKICCSITKWLVSTQQSQHSPENIRVVPKKLLRQKIFVYYQKIEVTTSDKPCTTTSGEPLRICLTVLLANGLLWLNCENNRHKNYARRYT